MRVTRVTAIAILALAIVGGVAPQNVLEKLSMKSGYSWHANKWEDEQLQVVLSTKNIGKEKLDIPGQFLWQVHYIPNATSVKRMEGKQDSVKEFADSVRAAGGKFIVFRCGQMPEYPRLMNCQLPQHDPHLKLSPSATVTDTLILDAIRSSYREWPGTIRVDWQFGFGSWWELTEKASLDSLRLEIPVP